MITVHDPRATLFAEGPRCLDDEDFEDRQLVVIDGLTWLGDDPIPVPFTVFAELRTP